MADDARPYDLALTLCGNELKMRFGTSQFRPFGTINFIPVASPIRVGNAYIVAESPVKVEGGLATEDIMILAEYCGNLEGFVGAELTAEGGVLEFETAEHAAEEAAFLIQQLYGYYGPGGISISFN